jgi:hypothetical protein
VTAGAALATLGCVAALSACAGASSHAPAAAVRAASCARATADLAAPGPYRVGSGIVASYATSFFLTYLDGVRSADGLLDPHRHRAARLSLRTVGMPPR